MGKLLAGGDSFTYGSELEGCFEISETPPPREVPSPNSYSALLAKELNLEYVCAAVPGNSNGAIRRSIMNAYTTDTKIVIVMWSFPGRYEFRFNDSWEQISPWSVSDDVEKIIRKDFHDDNPIVFQHHLDKLKREQELGISAFAKSFYTYVGGSEYWETYNSLLDIITLQNFLELKKVNYLFLGVDQGLLNNTERHKNDTSISALVKELKLDKWFWFPSNRGFYTWAKDEKFPFATTHPREPAHIEAANLIYEHIRNIGWIS